MVLSPLAVSLHHTAARMVERDHRRSRNETLPNWWILGISPVEFTNRVGQF
jgi:hypothetical protein